MAENNEKQKLEKEIEELKKDLSKLRKDFTDTKTAAEKLGKDSAKYAGDAIKDNVQVGIDQLEKCMDKHPTCTVFVAFSAGVVAAALLGRSK